MWRMARRQRLDAVGASFGSRGIINLWYISRAGGPLGAHLSCAASAALRAAFSATCVFRASTSICGSGRYGAGTVRRWTCGAEVVERIIPF